MSAVHEVTSPDGECLYRGLDVDLACEVYEKAPAGSHMSWHRLGTPDIRRRVRLAPHDDEPVPYALTGQGYDATSDDSPVYWLTPKGYADSVRATGMFVVDTTDVADLRRRCPELFVRHVELDDAS